MKHWTRAGLVAVGLLGAGAASAATTSFTLDGAVANPAIHDAATLAASPQEERTHREQVYGGVSLWGLIETAAPLFDPSIKHDLLRRVLVATGSDGYKAVYSLGELDPGFGGVGLPHIVATTANGAPLGENGFARVVSPEDGRPGRFVSTLASLEVVDLTRRGVPAPGGTSDGFTLSGAISAPGRVTEADLAGRTRITRSTTYIAGGVEVTESFSGVSLWDFLDSRGVVTDPSIKNDIFRKALIATGSDGYQVAYSLGEILPAYGDPEQMIMLAIVGGDAGFARLVFPGDRRGGRFVSNLVDLRVVDATRPALAPVPLPGAGLLYGAAMLGFIGVAARGRRRRV
ncbi:MAG: hypothetical protein ACK5MQ_15175 [Pikeienuella sp.]